MLQNLSDENLLKLTNSSDNLDNIIKEIFSRQSNKLEKFQQNWLSENFDKPDILKRILNSSIDYKNNAIIRTYIYGAIFLEPSLCDESWAPQQTNNAYKMFCLPQSNIEVQPHMLLVLAKLFEKNNFKEGLDDLILQIKNKLSSSNTFNLGACLLEFFAKAKINDYWIPQDLINIVENKLLPTDDAFVDDADFQASAPYALNALSSLANGGFYKPSSGKILDGLDHTYAGVRQYACKLSLLMPKQFNNNTEQIILNIIEMQNDVSQNVRVTASNSICKLSYIINTRLAEKHADVITSKNNYQHIYKCRVFSLKLLSDKIHNVYYNDLLNYILHSRNVNHVNADSFATIWVKQESSVIKAKVVNINEKLLLNSNNFDQGELLKLSKEMFYIPQNADNPVNVPDRLLDEALSLINEYSRKLSQVSNLRNPYNFTLENHVAINKNVSELSSIIYRIIKFLSSDQKFRIIENYIENDCQLSINPNYQKSFIEIWKNIDFNQRNDLLQKINNKFLLNNHKSIEFACNLLIVLGNNDFKVGENNLECLILNLNTYNNVFFNFACPALTALRSQFNHSQVSAIFDKLLPVLNNDIYNAFALFESIAANLSQQQIKDNFDKIISLRKDKFFKAIQCLSDKLSDYQVKVALNVCLKNLNKLNDKVLTSWSNIDYLAFTLDSNNLQFESSSENNPSSNIFKTLLVLSNKINNMHHETVQKIIEGVNATWNNNLQLRYISFEVIQKYWPQMNENLKSKILNTIKLNILGGSTNNRKFYLSNLSDIANFLTAKQAKSFIDILPYNEHPIISSNIFAKLSVNDISLHSVLLSQDSSDFYRLVLKYNLNSNQHCADFVFESTTNISGNQAITSAYDADSEETDSDNDLTGISKLSLINTRNVNSF